MISSKRDTAISEPFTCCKIGCYFSNRPKGDRPGACGSDDWEDIIKSAPVAPRRVSWAAENNGNFPVIHDSMHPLGDVWVNAIATVLYPEVGAKEGTANTCVWNLWPKGYEGTVFRSPNAQRGTNGASSFNRAIPSYGYNNKFTRSSGRNLMVRFSPSKTVMFADNDGKSHALVAVAYPGYGALNPRNGASAPYGGMGKPL